MTNEEMFQRLTELGNAIAEMSAHLARVDIKLWGDGANQLYMWGLEARKLALRLERARAAVPSAERVAAVQAYAERMGLA